MFHTIKAYLDRQSPKIVSLATYLNARERSSFYYISFTIILMLIALAVRLKIAPVNAGLQYVTFFPAVTLASVAGGYRAGVLATAIGLVFATYIFTPPFFSFSMAVFKTSLWPNMVFLFDGLIISLTIESMHRFRQHYVDELKQVKESELRIKAINKELDEFTYIASHDLKEPLRGIHNYASFLKEDYAEQLDKEGQQYINSIQRLAERMTALTDTLLAYSRLGSTMLKKEVVDVDAIMDAVAEDLSILKTEGVELRRTGKLGSTTGDATYIGEVFQNLIANAVKYNDKPQKLVEVGLGNRDAQPVYYVKDNGIGIKPEHQESVFRIFKRLHEQNKYGGGTGAGLTIVKKIIERHGGRIWLESTPGMGTTFYFTLSGGE